MSEDRAAANPSNRFVRPFVAALAEVTDFSQQPQYPIQTLLSVILLGLLCGQNTVLRIAAGAQRTLPSRRRRLQLPPLRVPSRSTLSWA
ncbi:MAG: hypothetical protein KatS3mg053_2438 [Candidatus Roseilinea sp.]|nr:MAG: hypothetical protein KatS3mg053_2438 [Candidatus Roseilinea sp.]